jgi:putative peptidoglycan lipid II flippase
VHATFVAAGILLSRALGLVRESLKARYLGATGGIAADAFHAAFKIPNLLQALFGEAALSASFIPVYANALARGDKEQAARLASAVGAFLALMTAALVLGGVTFANGLVEIIAPGFEGEKRELTILLTRILFPGAALFVFSAWCLGILNSHRRFFLSYAAPVAWNAAMIVALVWHREANPTALAYRIAWASVIGAALQFLVQLPTVLSVVSGLRLTLGRGDPSVALVRRNFIPAFFSRGAVQISGYVDQIIASFLPTGAVSLLFYTQTLTMLPISVFGMSVSAAELPEMSSATGDDDARRTHVRNRLEAGLRRIAFFVIPSAVAFIFVGDVVIAALFQSGRFTAADARFTWGILMASSIGLLATTLARLYSSAFFALHDTKSPFRIALLRVAISAALGATLALFGPRWMGVSASWGAAFLTLASSISGWFEFLLLRGRLNVRLGATGVPAILTLKLLVAAVVAGAAAYGVHEVLPDMHRFLVAGIVLPAYGLIYLAAALLQRVPEASDVARRLRLSRTR